MKCRVLSTGSQAGNCYVLTANDGEKLVLDVGITFNELKKSVAGKISNMHILVTHKHGDHSRGMKKAMEFGVDVFSSQECFEDMGVPPTNLRARRVEANVPFEAGSFYVVPFDVIHDVKCFGFLIYHEECGIVCYITDTSYIPTIFEDTKVNHFIIEANYCFDIMQKRVWDNKLHISRGYRVENTHLSIDECMQILGNQDLSEVDNILLVHLSDGNGNETEFLSKVKARTGRPTTMAKPGVELNFSII